MSVRIFSHMVLPRNIPAEPDAVLTMGPADVLNTLVNYVPLSIRAAVKNKDTLAARAKDREVIRQTVDAIVKATKAAQHRKDEDEEDSSSVLKKIAVNITKVVVPKVVGAVKFLFRFLASTVIRVAAFVFTGVKMIVGGIISFLLANPAVAIAAGIAIVAYGVYRYFKNRNAPPEPENLDLSSLIARDKAEGKAATPATSQPELAPAPATVVKAERPVATDTATPASPTAPVVEKSVAKKAPTTVAKASPASVAKEEPVTKAAPAKDKAKTNKGKTKQAKIEDSVANALQIASQRVDVPLNLLTAMAGVESSFKAAAGAETSSAKGLFQFIGSTWIHMLKNYGARYGLDKNASQYDPVASSIMAAAMMKHEGYPAAVAATGGKASITDIYITHFLGAGGGKSFIKGYQTMPDKPAADYVGAKEVKANANIFYQGGVAQSFKQIYDSFSSKLSKFEARTQEVAAVGNATPATATPPAPVRVATTAPTTQAPSGSGASQAQEQYAYIPQGKNKPVVRARVA